MSGNNLLNSSLFDSIILPLSEESNSLFSDFDQDLLQPSASVLGQSNLFDALLTPESTASLTPESSDSPNSNLSIAEGIESVISPDFAISDINLLSTSDSFDVFLPEFSESAGEEIESTITDVSNSADLAENFSPLEREFNIVFDGNFTPEAELAFQFAVDIWDSYLDLEVPITIEANFLDISEEFGLGEDSTVLAAATPNGGMVLDEEDGLPVPVLATQAQANEFFGTDGNGDEVEILTFFDDGADFFFGIEGVPGADQFDFVSVVMHEIFHGLGISDSFSVDEDGIGDFGLATDGVLPTIFDLFVENGAGEELVNFEASSTSLGDQLTSNNIFFDSTNVVVEELGIGGGNAIEAYDGARPQLFAPTTFAPGSSIAHLDEFAFNPGNGNELQTPFAAPGEEGVRDPGPIGLGIAEDLGFTLASSADQELFLQQATLEALANESALQ